MEPLQARRQGGAAGAFGAPGHLMLVFLLITHLWGHTITGAGNEKTGTCDRNVAPCLPKNSALWRTGS